VGEIRIGYFLEDIAQEKFLTSLVERVAEERGLAVGCLRHDVRNATEGHGSALTELGRFLRDVSRERESPFDVLVISIDSNCQGYTTKKREVMDKIEAAGYPGSVACAIPDPHIERWYLADLGGIRQALEAAVDFQAPSYKCEKDHYKQLLRDVIRQTGVVAPLGGAEYGANIARALNLYRVGKADSAFKHFCDELEEGLSHYMAR